MFEDTLLTNFSAACSSAAVGAASSSADVGAGTTGCVGRIFGSGSLLSLNSDISINVSHSISK